MKSAMLLTLVALAGCAAQAARTVDVHVRWLRTRIERDPNTPERLLTLRGVGYKFVG